MSAYSTYSVSLTFDAAFSASAASLALSLSVATGSAVPGGNAAPVHLTLGMFHVADEHIPALRSLFSEFAEGIGRGSPLSFSTVDAFKEKVLFLAADAESGSQQKLMALNARLHELLLPRFEPGANRNYLPGSFFPHVALAAKLTHVQFMAGMRLLEPLRAGGELELDAGCRDGSSRGIRLPLPAKVAAVSLSRCHPYEELACQPLRDVLSPEQRHKNMSHIRGTGGQLETALRSELFRLGFRFRKNDRRLSGSPDIVFPHYRAAVFVNGCFWHAHGWRSGDLLIRSGRLDGQLLFSLRCTKFRMPTTNTAFWNAKFERNQQRDIRDIGTLLDSGWRVGVVWECSILGKKRAQKIRLTAEKISLWLEEEYSVLFREF